MQFDFDQIHRPTLLVDESKARRNIRFMAEKASRHGLGFRPHFKTPQSLAAGTWYQEQGVKSITVSSVAMAEYFHSGGWRDILVAFPVNLREIKAINALAASCRLGLILDQFDTAKALSAQLLHPVDVWIEIDCGQKRSGLPAEAVQKVRQLASQLAGLAHLRFRGILTHAGHSYQARGTAEIQRVHRDSLRKLIPLKQALQIDGFRDVQLSYGDTPTCSVCEEFQGIDEIRPGNFVFYDLMQVGIGSCKEDQIAAVLACPVVEVYPEREMAVIHGGAVHLSKDSWTGPDGVTMYGKVGLPAMGGWTSPLQDCHVQSLSQEHGVVKLAKEVVSIIRPGDLLIVFPVHSCLTADLMGGWLGMDGIRFEMMRRPI